MPKKTSRKSLVKKLDTVFSQYIRRKESIQDISECFTCGKKDHWKSLQNGHFMSRKHYSTRWDEINCQVQCAGCNVFRYGEQYKFGVNLDQKYGIGTADEMHIKSRQIYKISDIEIIEKINYYKNLLDKY